MNRRRDKILGCVILGVIVAFFILVSVLEEVYPR